MQSGLRAKREHKAARLRGARTARPSKWLRVAAPLQQFLVVVIETAECSFTRWKVQDVRAEAAEQRLFVAWAATGVGSVAESSGLSRYQVREHCKQSHVASAPCISS